jgi:hypothetical protein
LLQYLQAAWTLGLTSEVANLPQLLPHLFLTTPPPLPPFHLPPCYHGAPCLKDVELPREKGDSCTELLVERDARCAKFQEARSVFPHKLEDTVVDLSHAHAKIMPVLRRFRRPPYSTAANEHNNESTRILTLFDSLLLFVSSGCSAGTPRIDVPRRLLCQRCAAQFEVLAAAALRSS